LKIEPSLVLPTRKLLLVESYAIPSGNTWLPGKAYVIAGAGCVGVGVKVGFVVVGCVGVMVVVVGCVSVGLGVGAGDVVVTGVHEATKIRTIIAAIVSKYLSFRISLYFIMINPLLT